MGCGQKRLWSTVMAIVYASLLMAMLLQEQRTSVGGLASSMAPKPDNFKRSQLFNSSKRRVPNGADPIHNRRAGKAWTPPGRA